MKKKRYRVSARRLKAKKNITASQQTAPDNEAYSNSTLKQEKHSLLHFDDSDSDRKRKLRFSPNKSRLQYTSAESGSNEFTSQNVSIANTNSKSSKHRQRFRYAVTEHFKNIPSAQNEETDIDYIENTKFSQSSDFQESKDISFHKQRLKFAKNESVQNSPLAETSDFSFFQSGTASRKTRKDKSRKLKQPDYSRFNTDGFRRRQHLYLDIEKTLQRYAEPKFQAESAFAPESESDIYERTSLKRPKYSRFNTDGFRRRQRLHFAKKNSRLHFTENELKQSPLLLDGDIYESENPIEDTLTLSDKNRVYHHFSKRSQIAKTIDESLDSLAESSDNEGVQMGNMHRKKVGEGTSEGLRKG